MIEIRPVEEAAQLQVLCRASHLSDTPACAAYQAVERGDLIAYCIYTLADTHLTLLDAGGVRCDAPTADGLLRTICHHARELGATVAHFDSRFNPLVWQSMQNAGYSYKTDNLIEQILTKCQNCPAQG